MILFKIAGAVLSTAVIFTFGYLIRNDFKHMSMMRPEKDILIKTTPDMPWTYIIVIAAPILYLWYIVGPWEYQYLLLILCGFLVLITLFGYIILRNTKNSLNNKYLALCLQKGVTFIPAGLNSKPVIKDKPWCDGRYQDALFVGTQGATDDAFRQYETKENSRPQVAKGLLLVIGICIFMYILWLVAQILAFGKILER